MSVHLYVQKADWKRYYDRVGEIRKDLSKVPDSAVRTATALVVRRIKLKIGEKKLVRSGTYRRSINAVIRKMANDVSAGYVGTWVEYAKWLEEGTSPHIISPRHGNRLFWRAKDGELAVARYVYHPGTKGYHVFEETMAESFDDIIEILLKEVKDRMVRRG